MHSGVGTSRTFLTFEYLDVIYIYARNGIAFINLRLVFDVCFMVPSREAADSNPAHRVEYLTLLITINKQTKWPGY